MSNNQQFINASLREATIEHLLRGGANVEQVCEVITKMYIVDKEDWDAKFIENQVLVWVETLNEEGKGPGRPIKTEVENWIFSNKCNKDCYGSDTGPVTLLLQECYRDLNLKTPNEKASCRMVFKRLVEKGKLEQVPNRPGTYRTVNTFLDKLDFINADTEPFHVKFPLGVHEFVTLYKKSLVVIAGEPNSGKTAFQLGTAWKNIHLEPNYFSSEMGAAELQVRLKKFPHPLEAWNRVKFYAKSTDFPKVIDPNGLNIIDYLEVAKDFYEIGGLLTDIFNALDKGVAIVAIQKPAGRDTGVGGERTLDKARLYLSISPGILKIVKGKIWRNENINPNGMWVKWLLGGGANFKIIKEIDGGEDWRHP